MAKEIAPELQNLMRQGGPLREQLEVQIYTGRATHEVHAIVELSDTIVALRRERDSFRQECTRLRAAVESWQESAIAYQRSSAKFATDADRLRAEVEALRADALRFAWFSDYGVCVDMFLDAPQRVLLWTHDGMFNAWTFAEAIDAARAAQGGKT